MKRLKELFKSKKASAVIESIMLTPIVVYVLLFTTFKVVSWVSYSNMYKSVSTSVHALAIGKDLEDGLNHLALDVSENYNDSVYVTSLKITSCDDYTQSITVEFDAEGSGSTTFRSFLKEVNGLETFNYDEWFPAKKENLENMWVQGNIIELEISKDLTGDFSSLFEYEIYNFQTQETETMSLGLETEITVMSSYVISS